MNTFLGALALGIVAIASTASAGWQETDWGMSVDEVRDAFEGAAPSDDPKHDFKGLRAQLRGPHSIDGTDGVASFGFRDDTLQAVNVSFRGRTECLRMQSLAHKTYGEPTSLRSMMGITEIIWSDPRNDNTMTGTWAEVEGRDRMICVFTYEQLRVPGQAGGL
jgi:hypothetical protein